jgi:hypothetical protein
MRLVKVETEKGSTAYVAPEHVTCLVGYGHTTDVFTYDEKSLTVCEDVDDLAKRIEAARERPEDFVVVGKDGEIVECGRVSITASEYRALLRGFYRGGVEDELKSIRERLAKLEGGAE